MPMHEPTAAELIAVCFETGSEAAWGELVKRFQPLIASVILRVVRRYNQPNRNIVDDLVQETFLRLCRDGGKALRQFDHRYEAAIFGYLKVVAASVATDYFRSQNAQKRMGEVSVDPQDLVDRATASETSAESHVLLGEIERCVNRATNNERDRAIFWLYYQQGLTAKDIANLPNMNLSDKGVESCLLRLLRAVRCELARRGTQAEGQRPHSALGEMR
jgi:RNA polymerase sigma-70 factor (ECF subfamily)